MTPLVRLWIWICAWASLAGWTLSALGRLDRGGYAVALAALAAFIFFRRRDLGFPPAKIFARRIFNPRRFRRPLPLAFAALASLVLLGGILYPPSNYTALTYHLPRVLHWLAAGQWHWIHTPDNRMNYSGCGFEWLCAPLLLFTHSVRGVFLFNFASFLLLPGLVFSVFTRLGVRPRAAWAWMWLVPTGYTFLLQAGSAANDAVSAPFALAAVGFACCAWRSRRPADLWHSALAVALLIGTKPTSLPLLLPWAVLVAGLLPLLRQKIAATALVMAVALAVSFLPVAVMNKTHGGGWLGAALDDPRLHSQSVVAGVIGNGYELLLDNFTPPVFPLAGWYDARVANFLPRRLVDNFQQGFFHVLELPTEDWSGIGFGVSALALVSFLAALAGGIRGGAVFHSGLPPLVRRLALATPWLALLAYCAKAGMSTPSRLVAPYYPLLLPLLLAGAAQPQIVRRRWWRGLAAGVVLLAFFVLMVSLDRPLWPAQSVLSQMADAHPNSRVVARALASYTVYSERSDALAAVRAKLPLDVVSVGFVGTADDCDFSLWLPLGPRRVGHFLLGDPPEKIRCSHTEYFVLSGGHLNASGVPLEKWLVQNRAELVATVRATVKVSEGPQDWFVVRLRP